MIFNLSFTSTPTTPLPYPLVRSKRRRRLAISIQRGEVRILAPTHLSLNKIQSFVALKQTWIEQALSKQKEQLAQRQRPLTHGSTVPLMGQAIRLIFKRALEPSSTLHISKSLTSHSDTTLEVIGNDFEFDFLRDQLILWYRKIAYDEFYQRSLKACASIGQRFERIKIGQYKSKWGSCSSTGTLSYHWALIMAPESVVDYMVAHEVSHLVHHNHSKAFWEKVASLCPDYQIARRWLKTYGLTLGL